MAGFKDIVGNEQIIEHLQNAISMGKVSHAYIINGPQLSGKMMIAEAFARALQCEKEGTDGCGECKSCHQADDHNHPDIIYVSHEKPNNISVDDIRTQLNNDIVIKPYSSKYKIYIVDEAEKMNQQAQNALLKTIEEPPAYAVIMLLTTNADSFLQTIRSRCITLNMKSVKDEVIKAYLMNEKHIPDYQAAALAMAIFFNGMTPEETAALTLAMAHSGDVMDLSPIKGVKVDKHSTGGVGDKTSLVLGPMVAALGVPVAKMSGRGLGHTGGTIDKLESFPGFQTGIPEQEFFDNVNRIGIAIAGQTGNLAPADKKLYALRDVTATVESIPLIASSIMSKKIAAGADVIVLDVKVGSGAFMKDEESAVKLADTMVRIGDNVGKKTMAVVSDMDEPLGYAVGNALEVKEAIDTLAGNGPQDLYELCLELGSHMVAGAGKAQNCAEAKEMLAGTIKDGSALRKLAELVEAQGGNPEAVYDTELLPKASIEYEYRADTEGYVSRIVCDIVGTSAMVLGGGRENKDSVIDLSVGIVLEAKKGAYVHKGDVLARFYANDENKLSDAVKRFADAYVIEDTKPAGSRLIKKVIMEA